MAELEINTPNIISNIRKLNSFFQKNGKKWSMITKVLSGDPGFLKKLLKDDIVDGIHSIGDSRLSSLQNIKKINPKLETIYIKPPPTGLAKSIVKYADISLNSSLETIKLLNTEAKKQKKIHKIIIMIEMGELREGVLREDLTNFYAKVFNLSNIEVCGIGSNLGCMYGIEPTNDKLIQLSLYKQLLEAKFNKKIELVSGGSSITLPLVNRKLVPEDMNHFRIGEAVFFGTSPLEAKRFGNLSTKTFSFNANIIELEEKGIVPDGNIGEANIGHTTHYSDKEITKLRYKAILDFGILDVDTNNIQAVDKNISFVGTTSDMSVYDIGENITKVQKQKYKVGNTIKFKPNYLAVARLMNSRFMDIKII